MGPPRSASTSSAIRCPAPLTTSLPDAGGYSFVWYRPVDAATTLAEMQTDATGRVHSEGIPPQLIRPEVIAALRRDAEAMLPPVFAEIVRTCAQPLFQPIGDLESPMMRHGRVALLGDAAFVARPHVAKGAIKAGHDAIELAAALTDADVEDGLTRYDAVRRPASALVVAEFASARRLHRRQREAHARSHHLHAREWRRRDLKQGRWWPVLPTAGEELASLDNAPARSMPRRERLEVTIRVLRERRVRRPVAFTLAIRNVRLTSTPAVGFAQLAVMSSARRCGKMNRLALIIRPRGSSPHHSVALAGADHYSGF